MSKFGDAQKILVDQLKCIKPPDLPADNDHTLFAFAGRLRNLYGYDPILKVLSRVREGSSISYLIGACKKEFEKSIDYTVKNGVKESKLITDWRKQ